jgi:hypothetical protein
MNSTKQKDKALVPEAFDSSSTNVIQSARTEHDLRALRLPCAKPRRVAFFYALLSDLAYPVACAGDDDDLVLVPGIKL